MIVYISFICSCCRLEDKTSNLYLIIPLFHLFTNIFLKFLFSLIMPTAMLDFSFVDLLGLQPFSFLLFIMTTLYWKPFVCVCVFVSEYRCFCWVFCDYEICSTFCFRVLKKGGKKQRLWKLITKLIFFLLCFMYVLIVLTVSVLELNKFWYQFLYWKNRNSLFW